jgi:hypothetical protein
MSATRPPRRIFTGRKFTGGLFQLRLAFFAVSFTYKNVSESLNRCIRIK